MNNKKKSSKQIKHYIILMWISVNSRACAGYHLVPLGKMIFDKILRPSQMVDFFRISSLGTFREIPWVEIHISIQIDNYKGNPHKTVYLWFETAHCQIKVLYSPRLSCDLKIQYLIENMALWTLNDFHFGWLTKMN